jgi:peroxiredoxin
MQIALTRLADLVLVAALTVTPTLAHALAVGDGFPEGTPLARLNGADEKEIHLNDVKGAKGTLVIFTCNHCPYAKAWEDRIVAIGNEYAKKGIGVIAINSNDPKAAPEDDFEHTQQRWKDKGFQFPYAMDPTSEVAKAFGATRTPEVFLFDASGKLAYHGAIDDNSEDASKVKDHYLSDALASVVAGKAPSPAETKSIGCGIKFRSPAGA